MLDSDENPLTGNAEESVVKASWLLGCVLGLSSLIAEAAPEGDALFRSKGCLACHQVDSRVVGPSFREVAERYATPLDAGTDKVSYLAGRIRAGSQGVWGGIPMPPNAALTEEETRQLAEWILKQRP